MFPLLLTAFGWVGIDPAAAGRWVNATAFGLTILAAGCWLRSNLRSRLLTLAATATLAASLPLSHWAALLRTESLFVLLTLLALMQLAAFLNRRTAAPLLWAAVFTALAAITRYPGVVLIGVGVFVLLVRRAVPLAARLKDAIVFGVVSSLPLAGVLTHNWSVSGTLTGPRRGSGQALSDVLSRVAEAFREWVIPPNTPDGLGYLLWLAAGLVGAAGAVVVWSGRNSGMDEGDRTASPLFGLGPVLPFGVFAVAYLIFIVAVTPFIIPHRIGLRLLLPVYVPLLLVAVSLLDRFLSIEAAGWMRAVRYGLAALVLLATLVHIGFSARESLRRTTQAYVTGNGNMPTKKEIARWQQSETLNYIRDNHIKGRIYSNWGELAWFWIANKMGWDKTEAGVHIFWLGKSSYRRTRLGYDYLDLCLLPGIEIVAELADGVVFRRTAYEPFDEDRHRARKQRYVNQLIQQASEHVSRAGWTVYRTGRKLIYRKQPCAPADVQAKFVLHVVPADPADLPAHRQQHDSDNLDFYFTRSFRRKSLDFRLGDQYIAIAQLPAYFRRKSLGFRLGDQCIAIAQLPAYAIDRIHIGQWVSGEDRTLWEAEFPASQ